MLALRTEEGRRAELEQIVAQLKQSITQLELEQQGQDALQDKEWQMEALLLREQLTRMEAELGARQSQAAEAATLRAQDAALRSELGSVQEALAESEESSAAMGERLASLEAHGELVRSQVHRNVENAGTPGHMAIPGARVNRPSLLPPECCAALCEPLSSAGKAGLVV